MFQRDIDVTLTLVSAGAFCPGEGAFVWGWFPSIKWLLGDPPCSRGNPLQCQRGSCRTSNWEGFPGSPKSIRKRSGVYQVHWAPSTTSYKMLVHRECCFTEENYKDMLSDLRETTHNKTCWVTGPRSLWDPLVSAVGWGVSRRAVGRSLAWERPAHSSACTAQRVSGCSRSSPDCPHVPGAAPETRSTLILSPALNVCLEYCPALGQFPGHHGCNVILDLPECKQVNILTHSTPNWHFLTHCKTREKVSVLALSSLKLRYGLNLI